jgi:hypothetical protein
MMKKQHKVCSLPIDVACGHVSIHNVHYSWTQKNMHSFLPSRIIFPVLLAMFTSLQASPRLICVRMLYDPAVLSVMRRVLVRDETSQSCALSECLQRVLPVTAKRTLQQEEHTEYRRRIRQTVPPDTHLIVLQAKCKCLTSNPYLSATILLCSAVASSKILSSSSYTTVG